VVIAKWLFRQAQIFLFDEPTRGIDVGAKVEVFNLMHELARAGAAILMVSSEMPDKVPERPADSIRVLENDAALRVLQAYYKGLRFAIDCQKDFANGQ